MASRLVILFLLAGCARTTLSSSVVDSAPGEMDFWDEIAKQRAVSNHDALYALLVTFEAHPDGADFGARVAAARARGWLGGGAEPVPEETARTGWIAKVVCIETGIEGGATMRLTGPTERYAVHELNYRKWLADMTPQQSMSGLQLIALLGAAEDHVTGAPETNPEDLPR